MTKIADVKNNNKYLIIGILIIVIIAVFFLSSFTGKATTASCIQSDGPRDIYTMGTITGYKDDGSQFGVKADGTLVSDYCYTNGQLIEYYCDMSLFNNYKFDYVTCPAGTKCDNGACKSTTSTTSCVMVSVDYDNLYGTDVDKACVTAKLKEYSLVSYYLKQHWMTYKNQDCTGLITESESYRINPAIGLKDLETPIKFGMSYGSEQRCMKSGENYMIIQQEIDSALCCK